jgi:hypothetical protein
MRKDKTLPRVGDGVVFIGQSKTKGVIVEIHDKTIIDKDVKVHWHIPPEGKNFHRNGRGSYYTYQLKLMRI